ncbi:MAG: hypothetical protein ACHQ4J_08090, partial [Candidatus Binatia bacterium]
VSVILAVAVTVGDRVGVDVGVAGRVGEAVGVTVAVTVAVGVALGTDVRVTVGVGVDVPGVASGDAVNVRAGVKVIVAENVAVTVNEGVRVAESVNVAVAVGVCVDGGGVPLRVGGGVGNGVTAMVAVLVGDAPTGVTVGVRSGAASNVISADRSAAVTRPSPLASVPAQLLGVKIAATTAVRSAASSCSLQSASPGNASARALAATREAQAANVTIQQLTERAGLASER